MNSRLVDENPDLVERTFEKGYTCKLVFYLNRILGVFFAASVLALIAPVLIEFVQTKTVAFGATPLQIFSPVAAAMIMFLISRLHKADSRFPSGCWQAWREINLMHKAWMSDREALMNTLVCQRNGGHKTFAAPETEL